MYKDKVVPYLDRVREWASSGGTDKEIMAALDISSSSFYDYALRYPEFSDALKGGRQKAIMSLKAALFKRAYGFTYIETKTTTSESGERVEEFIKYQPPDPAACNLLLKNWDKFNWSENPANLDLKREELEFRKTQSDDSDLTETI
ncbi:MAG: hypothetical protein LBU61_02410 [Coriobacteriales bacterium]|nr:hypothetical protein [Coriobacteriales bacterium]